MTEEQLADALALTGDDVLEATAETMQAHDAAWFYTTPGSLNRVRKSSGLEASELSGLGHSYTVVRVMPDGSLARLVLLMAEDVEMPNDEASASYLFDGGRSSALVLPGLMTMLPPVPFTAPSTH